MLDRLLGVVVAAGIALWLPGMTLLMSAKPFYDETSTILSVKGSEGPSDTHSYTKTWANSKMIVLLAGRSLQNAGLGVSGAVFVVC